MSVQWPNHSLRIGAEVPPQDMCNLNWGFTLRPEYLETPNTYPTITWSLNFALVKIAFDQIDSVGLTNLGKL